MTREGTDPLWRMSHLTFLPSDLLQLSVLSFRVITMKGFVFSVFLLTDFRLVNPVVCFYSVFWTKWPFSNF